MTSPHLTQPFIPQAQRWPCPQHTLRASSLSNLNDNYPIWCRMIGMKPPLRPFSISLKSNRQKFLQAIRYITQSPLMHCYGKVQISCHIAPSREWIMHVWAHGNERISPTVKVPAPMLSRPAGITSASDALNTIGTRNSGPGSSSVG